MQRLLHFMSCTALIALLLTSPALTALAQGGEQTVNCNGLSDADCQIITDATTAMQGLHAFSVPEWGVNLTVDSDQETVQIHLAGSGALVMPQSLMALISDLPPMAGLTDLAPIIAFYEQLDATTLLTMLQETSGYLVLDEIVLPEATRSTDSSIEIIFKDMGLYLHAPSPTGTDAWFGEKLTLTPADLDELETSLAELLTKLQSEETAQAFAQISELSGPTQRFYTLLSTHISSTRGPDAVFNGQTMFTFTTSFDLEGFLNDPNLPSVLISLLKNPALAALELEMGELETLNETQIRFVLMTAGLLLADSSITMEQWIGADDGYLHRFGMDLSLDLNLELLAQEIETQSATIDGSVYLTLDDINTATLEGITVPIVYYPLDDTEDFLSGTPAMIKSQIVLGQVVSGTLSGATEAKDIYSLKLNAGDSVEIALVSEAFPYLSVYGPDGFLVTKFDTYRKQTVTFTAEKSGLYLFVVYAYWNMDYEMTVSAPQP
ncbi:MAG: hypothetical protein KJ047_10180 [Anaerolineae bacterium]|nr:hypothetical protein [Anaerolineae bacterium]